MVERKMRRCDNCSKIVPKEEYYGNKGMCDECIALIN
jgi:hypothetical protein